MVVPHLSPSCRDTEVLASLQIPDNPGLPVSVQPLSQNSGEDVRSNYQWHLV
jgi:hypothetical protein